MNKRRRQDTNFINIDNDNDNSIKNNDENSSSNSTSMLINNDNNNGGIGGITEGLKRRTRTASTSDSSSPGNNNDGDDDEDKYERSDIRGDKGNIALLFFLYLLQGIPLGLTAAIPMLLQNRGATYKQQAEFSFAYWPFSLKLLWAPIVDALFWQKFGRRKSWLIPTQYLIGIFMLILSAHVNRWLGEDDSGGGGDGGGGAIHPNIPLLTMIFFALNFLAATQDIAVDGWALTMLRRCNVGHASTCNSVGQTAGYFLGYVVFIALESADFCNSYIRSEPEPNGIVTLPGFLWFWGICFLTTTTFVAVFKRETTTRTNGGDTPQSAVQQPNQKEIKENDDLNIKQTYKLLWNIIKMRPIQILAIILLTVKLTFAACDAVTSLKLIDAGVPKDKLAILVVPLVPLQIILPLVISKYTTGPKPMEVYLKALPYRICFSLIASIIVWFTPLMIVNDTVPIYYYLILLINYGFYQIFLYSMFVAVMAFFARISDPTVGGTYMTLLNTICNLGNNWPTTIALWLVDVLTWRQCINGGLAVPPEPPSVVTTGNADDYVEIKPLYAFMNNTCSNSLERDECTTAGGKCDITIDGYYIECLICLMYGLIWYMCTKERIRKLQNLPASAWQVVDNNNDLKINTAADHRNEYKYQKNLKDR